MKAFPNASGLTVVAEIGVNHEGDFAQAKKLLTLAAKAGAHFVKFQSYTPERFVAAHDQARVQRVTRFGLSEAQFQELARLADELNVGFFSTPVTEDWVHKLDPICPVFKIASGDLTFKPVIEAAAKTGKPIILSTGASTLEEVETSIQWVENIVGRANLYDRLILMHCVSAYPTPTEQANLRSIPFLQKKFGLRVGYSNHVMGINACLGAVALGAEVIEVHFTDCKTGRDFRDHSLSFDENDMANFITAAQEVYNALGEETKKIHPCEQDVIPLMRKGIVAARPLKAGQVISPNDLMFARPATEFGSNEVELIVGQKLKTDIHKGYLIPRTAI